MDIKTKVLLASAFSLWALQAKADCSFYVKSEIGAQIPQRLGATDYNNTPRKSPLFGVAVGKHLTKDLTIGLSVYRNSYRVSEYVKQTQYSQKLITTSAFLDLSYNIADFKGFVPYITAGVGASHNNAGTYKASGRITGIRPGHSKTYPAFNVGFGIKKRFKNCEISTSYKYFDLDRAKTSTIGVSGGYGVISTPVVAKLNNHAILTGITYHF
jgi:hypothetical protein